jgi:hypothetical protein
VKLCGVPIALLSLDFRPKTQNPLHFIGIKYLEVIYG